MYESVENTKTRGKRIGDCTDDILTKEDRHRSSVGKLVSEEMFEMMKKVAIDALRGILNTVESKLSDEGASYIATKRIIFKHNMLSNWTLRKKWNVNFLALLLVFGNGKRNQVYNFLKCPSVADMLLFKTEKGGASATKPLKISIHEDKRRIRDNRMPYLMLDSIVFDYVDFHVHFSHLLLLRKFNITPGTKDWQKILLDTRNGKPLNSDNVRHTLSSWIRSIDPELNIIPMDFRSSYATIMIRRHPQRHKLGKDNHFSFQTLTEEQLICMLACVMNTGVEKLRSVYAAASHSNYDDSAVRVMHIVKN